MNKDELLEELGYTKNAKYIPIDDRNNFLYKDTIHNYKRLKKTNETKLHGTYYYSTSENDKLTSPRIAVQLATAQTKDEAREIHRKIWNVGNTPILMIQLPNEILVYNGFEYDGKKESKLIDDSIENTLESVRDKLKNLYSENIDSGKIWSDISKKMNVSGKIDKHLLKNLKNLGLQLKNKIKPLIKDSKSDSEELSSHLSNSLIGKYLYIRYLRDRNIISNRWLQENKIRQEKIFSREATLSEFRNLIAILEKRLNGKIFPFPEKTKKYLNDNIIKYVASVFKGDDTDGQQAFDFKIYDFSYIPIEFISLVYEQFLHLQEKADTDGAFYTPEPLADYLVCELNSVQPLKLGMKILDPSCGSGIFLVLIYRKLIELALKEKKKEKLNPAELREILEKSIFGIERNKDACHVTEFSLILTLLSYLEPSDLSSNPKFKFPSLHGNNIIEIDAFNDKIFDIDHFKKNSFDWVIGNPPWIEIEDIEKEKVVLGWINQNVNKYPVSHKKTGEAFLWRVRDFVHSTGTIGLLVQSTILHNLDSKRFRNKFFNLNSIVRITDFSNLAFILFESSIVGSATIIYKTDNNLLDDDILHLSPFGINQATHFSSDAKRKLWSISINSNEIKYISKEDSLSGDSLIWKIALWGNYKDQKILKRIKKILPLTLGGIEEKNKRLLYRPIELRDLSYGIEKLEKIEKLKKYYFVNLENHNKILSLTGALEKIGETYCYLRKRGGKKGLKDEFKSTLILNPKFYSFHNDFIVAPSGQNVLSGLKEDEDYFRALSIFLNSSLNFYSIFFLNPQMGVDRTRINLTSLKKIPIPDFTNQQIRELSFLHKELSRKENEDFFQQPTDVSSIIDKEIPKILNIPREILVITNEFRNIRYSLNKGRIDGAASKKPTQEQLNQYADHLRLELDDFVEDQNIRHEVIIHNSSELIVCEVIFHKSGTPFPVRVLNADRNTSELLREIRDYTRQRFSQWFYYQKTLKVYEQNKIILRKIPRLIDWTATQAMIDGDEIIADLISAGKGF